MMVGLPKAITSTDYGFVVNEFMLLVQTIQKLLNSDEEHSLS